MSRAGEADDVLWSLIALILLANLGFELLKHNPK